MISYDDTISAHPELRAYPQGDVEFWVNAANEGMFAARFGKNLERAQRLYVAHNVTKAHVTPMDPPIDKATKRPMRAHQWTTTKHGQELSRLALH